jgi:hypothetical protein
MDALSQPVRHLPLILLIHNLLGCSPLAPLIDNPHQINRPSTVELREKLMHDRWAGKTYAELVEQLGKPLMVMSIPRDGWPPSSAIHYGASDQQSGCIDAFLVLHGDRSGRTAQVLEYFCR